MQSVILTFLVFQPEPWMGFLWLPHKLPPAGGLQTLEMYFPGPRGWGLKSRCGQGRAPTGGIRGVSFLLLPAPGAPGVPGLVAASLQFLPLLPPGLHSVSVSCPLFARRGPTLGHTPIQCDLLQIPCFQRRLHSEVAGRGGCWGALFNTGYPLTAVCPPPGFGRFRSSPPHFCFFPRSLPHLPVLRGVPDTGR